MRKAALLAGALLLLASPAFTQEITLVDAVKDGDRLAVKDLLDRKADPNIVLPDSSALLSWAVAHQNAEIVRMMLSAGANPNVASHDGTTPLMVACELSDTSVVDMLLDAKAGLKPTRPDGIAPLEVCAKTQTPQILEKMIAAGAAVDAADANGQTPLMWAAMGGKADNIAVLLKHGAKVNAASKKGFTPLFFAVKSGVLKAPETVLDAGGEINHVAADGTTAIMLSTYQRDFDIAAMLAKRGAELNHWDENGNQPLHVAAIYNASDLAKVLIEKGANVNAVTLPPKLNWRIEPNAGIGPIPKFVGMTPLLVAASSGSGEIMKTLVANGAKTDFVADDGSNVVLAAAVGGSASALAYAIELKPDLTVVNDVGNTALHLVLNNRKAQVRGHLSSETPEMVRVLAKRGASLDTRNFRGQPPNPRRAPEEVIKAFEEAVKSRGQTLNLTTLSASEP